MSSDYAKATGAPSAITLGGKEYRVYKLRPRDVGEIEAWFKDVTPNPRKEAREYMAGVSDAVAMHIWDSACREEWPPTYGSDRGHELMMSPEGQARFVFACLRRGFADGQFTLDSARDLADAMTLDEFLEAGRLAAPGDPSDPLAGSGPTTAEATPTTPTTTPPAHGRD